MGFIQMKMMKIEIWTKAQYDINGANSKFFFIFYPNEIGY